MAIDYEKEVTRHPLVKHHLFGTLVTFTFTEKYPKGRVERLTVCRDLLGAYTVTIWIKYRDAIEFRFENRWDDVEKRIMRLLQKHDCRPFKIGSP
jgi:hypothetical protein